MRLCWPFSGYIKIPQASIIFSYNTEAFTYLRESCVIVSDHTRHHPLGEGDLTIGDTIFIIKYRNEIQ